MQRCDRQPRSKIRKHDLYPVASRYIYYCVSDVICPTDAASQDCICKFWCDGSQDINSPRSKEVNGIMNDQTVKSLSRALGQWSLTCLFPCLYKARLIVMMWKWDFDSCMYTHLFTHNPLTFTHCHHSLDYPAIHSSQTWIIAGGVSIYRNSQTQWLPSHRPLWSLQKTGLTVQSVLVVSSPCPLPQSRSSTLLRMNLWRPGTSSRGSMRARFEGIIHTPRLSPCPCLCGRWWPLLSPVLA